MNHILIIIGLIPGFFCLECYNDNMMPQYCSAATQYCLKADAYNGQIYRGCAYMQDCPQVGYYLNMGQDYKKKHSIQGQTCAPITYSSDGTTDYVCCCVGDLCNSADYKKTSFSLIIIPMLLYILPKFFT